MMAFHDLATQTVEKVVGAAACDKGHEWESMVELWSVAPVTHHLVNFVWQFRCERTDCGSKVTHVEFKGP